jgi:hypothetical protein
MRLINAGAVKHVRGRKHRVEGSPVLFTVVFQVESLHKWHNVFHPGKNMSLATLCIDLKYIDSGDPLLA